MSGDPEVIILGAGAAGLSAAVELAQAGLKVLILEAQDRLGGRMFTLRDPVCNIPVELGAEFIHGRPAEIFDILQNQKVRAQDVVGEDYFVRDGELHESAIFAQVDEVLAQLDDRAPDESFLQFLERCCPDPKYREAKEWARRYVTGFHAADPGLISVHSLVRGMRAEEKIEGHRAFRIATGYQFLVEYFHDRLNQEAVSVECNQTVETVRWRAGQAEVVARSSRGMMNFVARCVLVTLPLSVLQAKPGETAAVSFVPALPGPKQRALDYLAMGKVIRITLRFSERFWEKLRPANDRSRTLANLRFLLSEEDWFPTWWTTMPERLPIITGWAPFRYAERLSDKTHDFVVQKAVAALSTVLQIPKQKVESLLEAAYSHDWQADPFSRGAYSYVKVGGDTAQSDLAAPVDQTLFFAGEATNFTGHHGTVHGAIASGRRASQEILRSIA